MTGKFGNNGEKLERLTDALIEDILNTSDQDIINEAQEDYGDAESAANQVRVIFQHAKMEAGKAKLKAARRTLNSYATDNPRTTPFDIAKARQLITKYAANDSNFHGKLTMAARNADDLSDQDIKGIIEDMIELGILDSNGQELE